MVLFLFHHLSGPRPHEYTYKAGTEKSAPGSAGKTNLPELSARADSLTQPKMSKAIAGGGGSDRKIEQTKKAISLRQQGQDLEATLRRAVAEGNRETFAWVLTRLREDRHLYANLINRVVLSYDMPLWVRLPIIPLMRAMTDGASLDALLELSYCEGDPAIRAESIKALGVRTEVQAESRLREISLDSTDPAREMALSFLGENQEPTSRDLLLETVRQETPDNEEVLNAALYSLRHYNDQETIQSLLNVAQDETMSPRLRATALYSLGVTGVSEALPIIKANLASLDREVRYSAVLASLRVSDGEVSAILVRQLCDTTNYPHVRKAASASLSANATKADLNKLSKTVSETDGYGMILASDVFVAKQDKDALMILQQLAQTSSDTYVVSKLNEAITRLEEGVRK